MDNVYYNNYSSIPQHQISSIKYYLELVLPHTSLKKLIESKKIEGLYQKLVPLLQALQIYPELYTVLKKLYSRLFCSQCQTNLLYISLSCNHSLCQRCFSNHLGYMLLPPAKFENQPYCPICRSLIKTTDFKQIFSDWTQRLLDTKKRERTESKENIQCKYCKRNLNPNCFRGCKCTCLECQLDKMILGWCECGTFNVSISCGACRSAIDIYSQEKFAIFCEGHIHCHLCIAKCFGEFCCLVCKNSLEQFDIAKVLELGCKTCFVCKKVYQATYFLLDNYCVTCQYQNDLRGSIINTECDINEFMDINNLFI